MKNKTLYFFTTVMMLELVCSCILLAFVKANLIYLSPTIIVTALLCYSYYQPTNVKNFFLNFYDVD